MINYLLQGQIKAKDQIKSKTVCEINPVFLNKRSSVLSNLKEIGKKLRFRKQTYILSIGFYDKLMPLLIKESKVEMYGLVCLIIAGNVKYLQS